MQTVDWSSAEPPISVERPMLYQDWRDVAFLHWPLGVDALRPLVPRAFDIETFEGSAWLSLIAFRMPRIAPGALPPIPGIASANETHVRTYVRGPDGRAGIWMMSLDIDPLAAALAGRVPFALPYWWADMDVHRDDDLVRYRAQRRFLRPARLELDLRVGETYDRPKELDHFLTARWVLYMGAGPVGAAMLVEHPRWPLRLGVVDRLEEDLVSAAGISRPAEPPLVHFSEGVDAKLAWPRPFIARSG